MSSETRVAVHTHTHTHDSLSNFLKFVKKAVAQSATAFFVFLVLSISSCNKAESPCTENNTGFLVIHNQSSSAVNLKIDNVSKGVVQPGDYWNSGELSVGTHSIYADISSTGYYWQFNTHVTQCTTKNEALIQ
jgi:hypothetical protein